MIPLLDIVIALLLGAFLGFLLALSHRYFKSHTNRMSLAIAGEFWLGGTITHQPAVVKDNIGWALMPQAGVAIGMATMALAQLPAEYGQPIQTVILSATLVYEVIGPIASKNALKRAGEIHTEG